MTYGPEGSMRRADHVEPPALGGYRDPPPPRPLRGPSSASFTRARKGGGVLERGSDYPPPPRTRFSKRSPHVAGRGRASEGGRGGCRALSDASLGGHLGTAPPYTCCGRDNQRKHYCHGAWAAGGGRRSRVWPDPPPLLL